MREQKGKPATTVAGQAPFSLTGNSTLLVLGVVFFAGYAVLVHQMQGLDFDTAFLALYCTVLTVFIYRSLISLVQPNGAKAKSVKK